MLKDLWTWMAKSKVPDFGECTTGSPFCVAIKAILSSKECAPGDIFRKIFENELVITVLKDGQNRMVCTP